MRYIIPDVHGCAQTLKALVSRLCLSEQDVLYFLGDYIDKGKRSAEVLDYLIDLEKQHTVFFLRGNHEENIFATQQEYAPQMFQFFVAKINKSPCLLNEEGKIIAHYEEFMQQLPFYIELEDAWLVHAGFSSKEDFLTDLTYMIEGRKTVYEATKFKSKPIVHGHTVTYRQDIESSVQNRAKIIPLDNGCVYNKPHKLYDYTQTGFLCCLNLDSYWFYRILSL
jgi:serine/threonine protein phosphatase 1